MRDATTSNTTTTGASAGGAPTTDEQTFEFALVLSGATSAGAYTAGVVDFLIEALDAWEARKADATWNGPRHNVRLKIITGASAGGMVGAITASHLGRQFEHVTAARLAQDKTETIDNGLYQTWVEKIDIADLLKPDSDAYKAKGVVSLLNPEKLPEIATGALNCGRPRVPRGWVADPLKLSLTVSNLTGLPYDFEAQRGLRVVPYSMRAHGDAVHFAVAGSPDSHAPEGSIRLSANALENAAWKEQLVQAGLATGAFPFLLRPQMISRQFDDYRCTPQYWRHGFTVQDIDGLPRLVVNQPEPILPQAPLADMDQQGTFRFLAVDGAMIDNEPLEIARRELSQGHRNPRSSRDSRRAVILVNPFGSDRIGWRRVDRNAKPVANPETSERLMDVAPHVFGALINQARFKPEELELAVNETVFSRFILAPVRWRSGPAGRERGMAITGGILGGFGGFLHRSFRLHDYMRGRHNAQAFLKRSFVLSEKNKLFDGLAPGDRATWYVRRWGQGQDGAPKRVCQHVAIEKDAYEKAQAAVAQGEASDLALPIVPLVEPALQDDREFPMEAWPSLAFASGSDGGLAKLEKLLTARAEELGTTFIEKDWQLTGIKGWGAKRLLLNFGAPEAVTRMMAALRSELEVIAQEFAPEAAAPAPAASTIL